MPTIELAIPAPEDVHELLIALLEDDDVQAFEQRADELAVFFDAGNWNDARLKALEGQCRGLAAGRISVRVISERNWNEEWEASIRPIRVGRFVVRPSWAQSVGAAKSDDDSGDLIELIIDPKMSFGTAWHESTRLLLRSLPERVSSGDRVLDAGTGTGILAIASLKLGAGLAIGFDIDEWSLRNAPENALANGVHDCFEVRAGTLDVVAKSEQFDVVLANINRQVLLEILPDLMAHAPVAGLSGLLVEDRPLMTRRISELGLRLLDEREEGEWWSAWVEAY